MAAKIRSGDEIIVLTGKDKGKRGKVLRLVSTGKAIVENVNLIRKNQKAVPNSNNPGGLVIKEAPISLSNLAIFNLSTGKADRVKFKIENGKKLRVFKSSGKPIKYFGTK